VSDSHDPEFGTGDNVQAIRDALAELYAKLSRVLRRAKPMWILDLLRADLPRPVTATLTEREWRLLRFAIERATDSI
jgi:hypothetical protein